VNPENSGTNNSREIPLCVDLDGTLVRTDLLVEMTFALLKKNIFTAFQLPLWLLRGKAYLKEQIARRIGVDAGSLPYQTEFLDYLRQRKKAGDRLILTTASNVRYANAVAQHLGIFDTVLASDGKRNLTANLKLEAIQDACAGGQFDYAANGKVDLEVWQHANAAILVNPDHGVTTAVERICPIEIEFKDEDRNSLSSYIKSLRLHHWVKNLIVLLPLMLAHRANNPALLMQAGVAFLSFGFCASSVYLLNDMFDLSFDREHPHKRWRALASGAISVSHAAIMIPTFLLIAFLLALVLPSEFFGVLVLYYVVTLAYSLYLKHHAIVDVIVLASLYTLRVIAGAAAVSVEPSFWLLSFSMFFFLSLALVKRYSELLGIDDTETNAIAGRSYSASDLPLLAQFGTTSAFTSVLVLALYINSDSVRLLYTRPQVIWLLCPLLLYMVTRVWMLAHRNKIHEDPVDVVIRDRPCQLIGLLGIILLLVAV
jgi:4-hydroxybenzoate polyprenyltransferase/phosphoserine phosphatase